MRLLCVALIVSGSACAQTPSDQSCNASNQLDEIASSLHNITVQIEAVPPADAEYVRRERRLAREGKMRPGTTSLHQTNSSIRSLFTMILRSFCGSC
jgi:hypothetical protein